MIVFTVASAYVGYHQWIVNGNLPNVIELIDTQKPNLMSRVYGIDIEDGQEINVEIGRIYKQLTTLIPPGSNIRELELSIIAAEDANFYTHDGVDLSALAKALYGFIKTWHVRGASTITMQLVKSYVGSERTLARKVKEWYLAYHLEQKLTLRYGSKQAAKAWILWHYCNRAYVGHGGYGFERAANLYFNTSTDKLTTLQAAALAGLAKGAEKYTLMNGGPEEITASRQALQNRTAYVLRRRLETGTLSKPDFERLRKEPIIFTPARYEPGVCAEYVALVEKELRGMYAQDLETTALDARTTCVIPLQREARRLLNEHLSTIDSVNGILPKPQGTLVIVENDTGRIIALIGGDHYQAGDLVRAIESKRQPGSAAKILLFLAALEKGYLPTDAFKDGLTLIPPLKKGGKSWQPHNAHHVSGEWQTLRYAFKHSLNTVAAQLIYDMGRTAGNPFAGIHAMSDVAQRLNFSTPVIDEYSAALGVFNVRLVDMAGAIAAISHQGEYVEPHFLTHVRENTFVLTAREEVKKPAGWQTKEILRSQALTPEVAHLMWTMLRSVITEGTGIRAKNFPIPVGGKTGTSQKNRDTNFIGSSKKYTVGIWMGFDLPESMGIDKRTGREIQGSSNVPLFMNLMRLLYPEIPKEKRPEPPTLLHIKTVLEEFPDHIFRPRCATAEDSPEITTDDLYLPYAVPEGCSPELAPLAKPRPRGFDTILPLPSPGSPELIVTLPEPPPIPTATQEPAPTPAISTPATLPLPQNKSKETEIITKDEGRPEDFEP